MVTELLLNATVQDQWLAVAAGVNHLRIDEGDPPDDADYVTAFGSAQDNVIDIYGLPDTITDVDEVTQIEVLLYYLGMVADENPTGTLATIDIDLGGYKGAKTLQTPWNGGIDGWKTLTWAGLSGSQADLDGLEIKLSVGTLADGKYIGDGYSVWSMYIKVTYTPTAGAGWSHDFMGTLNANIKSINGTLLVNIKSVKGVDL